jgi:hypothetical protein
MSDKILGELKGRRFLTLTPEDLERLLEAANVLEEHDTHVNKSIRILQYKSQILLQEFSFEGEIIVRQMDSREQADAFAQSRLDTYERMWDGCGCKIDFCE